MKNRGTLLLLLALLALVGCGGGDADTAPDPAIAAAANVEARDFPAVDGRRLQEIADEVRAGPQVGLATSVYTPGRNRLAFGVIDEENAFLYGPTAVYIAREPDAEARGPFPAPTSSLQVEPVFRSAGAGDDVEAIYSTDVELERAGRYSVLVVTDAGGELVGASTTIDVERESPIPAPGERPPEVSTDTLVSASGDVERIDTRVPPSDLHDEDFADVIGEGPVALLFATPQLCQTRVCGPVTDIAVQLERTYGDRVEFIHQEVYVDNEVEKGLRPPLEAFRLETEPWLFTFDADGHVAARLEGSFGVDEFREAVEAAL